MFKEVSNNINFPSMEEKILKFWEKKDIFKSSMKNRKDNSEFVFYDGPPFATGLPHYGHILASIIKDIIPRYKTMKGYFVDRRFGWDCHGLPVENEMEKELELEGKKEIEEYGIDKFNEACRSIVLRYTKEWEKTIIRAGRWVDFGNQYRTMDLDFMESIWWVFKTIWEKNLIYEGNKILPYCPRCATPLSNFETNQGYKDTQDPAITVRFKVKTKPNTYILAWTTTPWTLPSNLALAAGPDIDYVKVKDGDDFYILAEALLGSYYKKSTDYEIVERIKGSKLKNIEYEPLFSYFAELSSKGAFRVILGDFVSTEDGTGIVHIAPGFGEDDATVGKENYLPVVCPVDEEGRFTDEITDYKGIRVKDADKAIIKQLKTEGKCIKHSTFVHSYPHCWRCDTPLIYKAISTWFVRVEKIKDKMLKSNSQIYWMPEHIKDGRFGKWLEGARDWAISRNRYWGNTIPVWRCADCGELKCIGSVSELKELSGEKINDIHKHFVDQIEIDCPRCQGKMQRVPEVFDCWFESGAMPYAQNHYPFENKKNFERHFPADFIAEGLDQTRGWFYTLIVLSTALFEKPAFKNVIVNGLVLAEDGKKMSKRLKNYPEPNYILHTYGADALRLYLMNSPVVKAEDLRFSEDGIKEVLRSILIPLWNSYSFFVTYANIDKWRIPKNKDIQPQNELDVWVISRLQKLIRDVTENMNNYDLQKSIDPIVEFIDQLTNWYIRRSRRRFWKSENDDDKMMAYFTLYTVLIELSKVLAPFIPFVSDEIYRNLSTRTMEDSVHLCDFPEYNESKINSEIEKRMELVMDAVSMGRSLRQKHQLKIRQPLKAIHLVTKNESEKQILNEMMNLIIEELNVKDVIFDDKEEKLVEISAKANFKTLGPRYGKQVGKISKEISSLTLDQIRTIEESGQTKITIDGDEIELTVDDILINRQEKEGLVVANKGSLTVALDSNLTEELISEGFARDFVNKVQNMRKEADFEVMNRIIVYYNCDEKLNKAILANETYIRAETLSNKLAFTALEELEEAKEWNVNGEWCNIKVEKDE